MASRGTRVGHRGAPSHWIMGTGKWSDNGLWFDQSVWVDADEVSDASSLTIVNGTGGDTIRAMLALAGLTITNGASGEDIRTALNAALAETTGATIANSEGGVSVRTKINAHLRTVTTGFVAYGDSLTEGSSASPTYPARLAVISGKSVLNRGTVGQPLSSLDSDFATDAAPDYDEMTANTLVVWGGINDILNVPGTTAASLEVSLRSICAKAIAAGYKVLVCTVLPSQHTSMDMDTEEPVRLAFNAAMRLEWEEYADGLVDLAADERLDDATDTDVYQSDKLHMTAYGHDIVAELVLEASGAARAATTFAASTYKTSSITLSADRLTAFGDGGAYSTAAISDYIGSGRVCVAFTYVDGLSAVGFTNGFHPFDGTTQDRIGINAPNNMAAWFDGVIYNGASQVGSSLGAWSAGDVLRVALDMDLRLIWFKRNSGDWNGSGAADPAAGTGGLSLPAGGDVRFACHPDTAGMILDTDPTGKPTGFTGL
jgi:hypothetical protein